MFCYGPNISLTFHVDISYSNGSFYQSKCILLFHFFCGMPRISELRTWQMASSCFVPGAQYCLFYWPGCSWSRKHPSPLLPGQPQQSDNINSTLSIHSSHCTHSTHPSPPVQPQQSDSINSTHSLHSSHCTYSTDPSPSLPGQPQQSDSINCTHSIHSSHVTQYT